MRNRRNRVLSNAVAAANGTAGQSAVTEDEDGDEVLDLEDAAEPTAPGNGFEELHQQLAEQREALTRLREQVAALRSEYARIGQDLDAVRANVGTSVAARSASSGTAAWPAEGGESSATEQPSAEQEQPAALLAEAQPTPTVEREPEQPPAPEPEPPRKRGLLSWGRR
jgi:hypothetical protein